MPDSTPRPPRGLAVTALLLFLIGLVLTPIIAGLPPEAIGRNFFVLAIPFLTIFIALILGFVFLIWVVAARLNGRISQGAYRPVEVVIVAGIVLGVVSMFQPFAMFGYQYGFLLLLTSTLAFILWSHITPRGA